MSSSSSFIEDDNMHEFVDRVLVKMGKDELASLLDVALDCLEEGNELAVSHSKLRELSDKGMLQCYDESLQFSNKNERGDHLDIVNGKITSMLSPSNEFDTHKQVASDSQLYNNSTMHKQTSDDSYVSDLTSDQGHYIESSIVKNKKYSKKRSATTDILSSNSCESEPVPKKLTQSKRKIKLTCQTNEFMFPVLREGRKKKIEETKTGKNKSLSNMVAEKSELTTLPNTHLKAEVQFCYNKHQLRTNHESKLTNMPNNIETSEDSSITRSKLEINKDNKPLSQRLKEIKCKSKIHLSAKQKKIELVQHPSENFEEGKCSERNLDYLEEGTKQKGTFNSTVTQKSSSPNKVNKNKASLDTIKMKSPHPIGEDSTLKTKPEHKEAICPNNTNELENTEELSNKSEHLNKDTNLRKKGKKCDDKSQKISPSLNKNNKLNSVDDVVKSVSEPIILRIKSNVKERNDPKQPSKNNEAESLQKKSKSQLNKQEKKTIGNITSSSCKNYFSSSEKQTFLNKTEKVTDCSKKQDKDGTLSEKEVVQTSLLAPIENVPPNSIDDCENDVITSDLGQLSSVDWMFPIDEDTGKESTTEYETVAEPDPSDSDYILASVSETELSYEPQKQTSSSLDDNSSEDEKRCTSKFDAESDEISSDSKYKKLKEQFQRAGLDLDKVAQSVDEQKLKKVIRKAGNDGGMLLRFPHFCPCSKKQVGQCLIILNSRTHYIKAKEKRPLLEK